PASRPGAASRASGARGRRRSPRTRGRGAAPSSGPGSRGAPLLPGNGETDPPEDLLEVIPGLLLPLRLAKQERRVVGRQDRDAVPAPPLPAQPRDRLLRLEEEVGRELPERHEDDRLHELD